MKKENVWDLIDLTLNGVIDICAPLCVVLVIAFLLYKMLLGGM